MRRLMTMVAGLGLLACVGCLHNTCDCCDDICSGCGGCGGSYSAPGHHVVPAPAPVPGENIKKMPAPTTPAEQKPAVGL